MPVMRRPANQVIPVRRILPKFPLGLLAALSIFLMLLPRAFGSWQGPAGPFHEWFVKQMQEPPEMGPCCGDEEHYGGDGRYVDVRSLPSGQHEVFVKEAATWILYPKAVKADYPNPTGQNVAWYIAYRIPESDGAAHWEVRWFCLRLAQGM